MAWTSVGFDGTINEAQWASLSGLLGNDYVAAGNGDCLATAVGGSRAVSVAAGSLYGDGVLSTNSGAETVAMTTPVNGQWYVIALRRTWATNTAALVAIAGATTSTTTPTAPPTSFPTLNTDKGVLTDQPIAWAWCNSANTTVVVYDIRLKAVKSLPPVVANANERDAKFMTPSQGLQVWRDDLGAVETYFGLYNASTNPGGRDAAGWYTNDRNSGLFPIKPVTVTIASGTGTANSLGKVSFTNATNVALDGVFTSRFDDYLVILEMTTSNYVEVVLQYRAGGVNNSASNVYTALTSVGANNTSSITWANPATLGYLGYQYSATQSGAIIQVMSPNLAKNTKATTQFISNDNNVYRNFTGGHNAATVAQYDGFALFTSGGTFTGSISVYGYNK